MWVEQRQPLAARDVLAGKICDQSRFAGAGLPDNVHVGAAIRALDAEMPPIISEVGLTDDSDSVVG